MEAGEPFGAVEDAIDEIDGLTVEEKSALWLLAFSLRDRTQPQREAPARLAVVN